MDTNGTVGVLLERDDGGSFIVGCVGDGRMWIRDSSVSRGGGIIDNDRGGVVGFTEAATYNSR